MLLLSALLHFLYFMHESYFLQFILPAGIFILNNKCRVHLLLRTRQDNLHFYFQNVHRSSAILCLIVIIIKIANANVISALHISPQHQPLIYPSWLLATSFIQPSSCRQLWYLFVFFLCSSYDKIHSAINVNTLSLWCI